MSVSAGSPAKISGKASATSCTAIRLRSPARCAGKRFSTMCALPMMPTTGLFIARLSCPLSQVRKGVVEAQPAIAAWAELRARARIDARAICDPLVDLGGRKPGLGEIDPAEIGRVEA